LYLISFKSDLPLYTVNDTEQNQARSANQCPIVSITTPTIPDNNALNSSGAPMVTHQVGKVGLKAVKNIPPVANDQEVSTNQETPVDITLTGTDADG